jgi:peptide/nickel transport system substrate-binding protein
LVRGLQKIAIGDFRNITTLNPLKSTSLGPADVLSLIFRGLGRFHPETGILVPDIATSWKIKKKDGTTFLIVHLRDNVRFHDETLLTATDVEFTYMMAAQQNSPWHQLVSRTISGIKAINNIIFYFQLKSEIAATLQPERLPLLRADQPLAQLLTLGILSQRTYEANPEEFDRHPIGSGPFQLRDFILTDTIQLSAFREYLPSRPRLDRIDIHIILEKTRLIQMLEAREIDATVLPYSKQLENQLRNSGAWKLEVFQEFPFPLLQVQSPQLQERLPNAFNTNWNAYLWYKA